MFVKDRCGRGEEESGFPGRKRSKTKIMNRKKRWQRRMSGTKAIRRMTGVTVGRGSITKSAWIRMAGIMACITKRIDGGFMITVEGEILTL